MKRYKKYKPSGIEWIGEIPEHWEVRRIKFNSYIKARVGWHGLTSSEYQTDGPYLVTGTDFEQGRINWDACYHVGLDRYEEDPFIQLKDSDLLITKDGTIGKVALAKNLPGKATLNSGVFVIRPTNEDYSTNYFFWAVQSILFFEFIKYHSKGSTINHLYQDTFQNLPFLLPSVKEQTVIADYLDRKTAQIEDLIAKKQNLIDLLDEEKTAIINQAVTKGLNADAPRKDSGIPWMGKMPAHWEVKKLKWYFQLSRGFDLSSDNFVVGEVPVYGSNGCIGYHNESTTKGPGVTIGRSGSVGEVNFIGEDFWAHNTCLFVYKNFGNNWKYIFYFLKNLDLKSLSSGSAVGTLNRNYIHDERTAFPPLLEQTAIVQHIEAEIQKIDTTMSKIEKEIQLLQEYRTALISDAVTGKIDVRI
jgi:type I restriction enzyme S subunit